MKQTISKMRKELKLHWQNYLLQSLAATVVIFLLILLIHLHENPVIIASIGATTFIIFATPKSIFATPRSVVGGHLTGLVCGLLGALIMHWFAVDSTVVNSLIYASAVGMAIFVMVAIDTEHAPAAGTALGIAINGFSLHLLIVVMVPVVILAVVHVVFKNYLKDLT